MDATHFIADRVASSGSFPVLSINQRKVYQYENISGLPAGPLLSAFKPGLVGIF
jgi:hypothetical protein